MWGQWLGKFEGTNSGEAILNIDRDIGTSGKLSIYEYSPTIPPRWANIFFTENDEKIAGNFFYLGNPEQSESLGLPTDGTLEITNSSDTELKGIWQTNIGTNGTFTLHKQNEIEPSTPEEIFTWDEFKNWLSNHARPDSFIYRGQSNNEWKLKTSFHRTGRYDLLRYANEDVHRLNHYLVSLLNRSFNISDPIEHGALLNLAQHHGFPTPLLDWTESPYIAAFFAFFDTPKNNNKGYVRLFAFNKYDWMADHSTTVDMLDPIKYFSIHMLLPLHNSRALPQQSVVTSTNVSDIEGWLSSITPPNRKYLTKIDIPQSQRKLVMQELSQMGITSASLFPGIEGTCRALKEKYF
jgi:hypothetical protein